MSEGNVSGASPGEGAEGAGGAPADTGAPAADPAGGAATVAPAAAEADPRAWLGEHRDAPALKDVSDPAQLAQLYLDQSSHLGNSIRIPSEHASPEAKAEFRQKLLERVPTLAEVDPGSPEALAATMRQLGAPEDAKGYKLPDLPEGMRPVEGVNEWAHAANLTQAQFEILATKQMEDQQRRAQEQAARHNADMEQLHRDWGYTFDDRLGQVTQFAKAFDAPPEVVEALQAGKMPASSLSWMHRMAEAYGKESDVGAGRDTGPAKLTPAEAQLQLAEIENNPKHPYWTMPPGPAKQTIIQEVVRLREMAEGKGSRDVAFQVGQEFAPD